MDVRDDILKSLEEARNEKTIGKSFEAHLTLHANAETFELLTEISKDSDLAQLLIVSQLDVVQADQAETIRVEVAHAEGETCQRCRAIKPEVGTIEDAPTLCERCADIVRTEFPEALVPETEAE